MKKEVPIEKDLRRFKRALRPSLFLPLFYTVVFGLVIASLYILNEQSAIVKVILTLLLGGVIVVLWFIYRKERNNAKSIATAMDEALEQAENGLAPQEGKGDESLETMTREIKRLLGLFAWFTVLTSLGMIFYHTSKMVAIPDFVFNLVMTLLGAGIAYVLVRTIHRWVRIRKLTKKSYLSTESKE